MKKIIYFFILFSSALIFAQQKTKIDKFVSVSISGITPIGIFAENWNIGAGIYVGYGWFYNNKWVFLFQTGYNKYRLKSESHYFANPKLSMLPIQFGGKRYFLNSNFRIFIETLSGINFIHLFYKDKNTKVDDRETHVNFQLGGGISYFLTKTFSVEGRILYNSHLINPSIPYNLTGFEYGIELCWLF